MRGTKGPAGSDESSSLAAPWGGDIHVKFELLGGIYVVQSVAKINN